MVVAETKVKVERRDRSRVEIEHAIKRLDGMLEPAVNERSFSLGKGQLPVLRGVVFTVGIGLLAG